MITLSKPKIVILGAGYGGMMTTVRLTKEISVNDAEITLVNKNNYHYQTTWLHEPAAGTLHHDRTRMLIKDVINTNRVNFVQESVVEIKKDEKKVVLENSEIDYDYLVISLGFESETFGIKGLKENAFSIQNVNTVRKIRDHIEYQFASYHNDVEKQDDRLTIIVGGGGFSGVEFVGELSERIPELCQEYDIDRDKVRLINIEAGPSILPGFDKELISYATKLLESRGVEFMIGTKISECTPDSVIVGDEGEEIKAATIVWTGGVRGNSIVEKSGYETMRGRIKVEDDMRAPGYEDTFVAGDCALIINKDTDRPYPPTAQIAIQEAYTVAKNLKHLMRNESTEIFSYKPKGTVASLGKGEAIGIVGEKKLYGTSASALKKIIDDRYLFLLGGPGLVLKKGKLKLF